MRNYRCEHWSMNDIAHAMKGVDNDERRIVIPIYQRGKRWEADKREKFINSLLQGFPVGTLLFAEQGHKTYAVIDGLQRSTTICEYILYPTRRDNLHNIEENVLTNCREVLLPGNENITINNAINEKILSYMATKSSFREITPFDIANMLIQNISNDGVDYKNKINGLMAILQIWYENYIKEFNSICETEIPVIVYTGDSTNLNEIFSRINRQGEPLDDYEIYAAIWRTDKYRINNDDIIEKVIKKYDSLILENYSIENYNSNDYRISKELTAFEYLFGLGKYLVEKFDFINLDKTKKDSQVTPAGFELADVCLCSGQKNVKSLAQTIYEERINLNKLERRIKESIDFVYQSIAPICDFKGNKRRKKYLHPKFFIYALIAFVLREMYDIKTLEKKATWERNRLFIAKQIKQYYVYDIISNEWHDGGMGKMYSAVRERKFVAEITKKSWESLLDNYFAKSLRSREVGDVQNPTNADVIILNCIYLNIFTANDQLSTSKFDIEHLATKEKMKRVINLTQSLGLPISSIANQCYLPEGINRKKKDKTIYEEWHEKGFDIPIQEIERKYSFTAESDFEFLDYSYENGDYNKLETEYLKFLERRFAEQKKRFFNFLGIE